MTQDSLLMIQPHVLDRLIQGHFVAERKQGRAYPLRDRRKGLSHLNVTRRAIRYEPFVFSNRRQELIQSAERLNQAETKVLMVSGPSGRGKTAFVRGIVELMGGAEEQLIWFDVSRHTDFNELIRFLVDSLTDICRQRLSNPLEYGDEDPVAQLEALLNSISHCPILIVVDNMEHLVTPDQIIRSAELKEAFNFLLSFPNIKLLMSGNRLPMADMGQTHSAVTLLKLPPLAFEASVNLVTAILGERITVVQGDLAAVTPYFQGEPVYLKIFATLLPHHPHIGTWLQYLTQHQLNPNIALWQIIAPQLSPLQKQCLGILSLLRHGATPRGLCAMLSRCLPACSERELHESLKSPIMQVLLKKIYPPQQVLAVLRQGDGEPTEQIEAWYELLENFAPILAQALEEDDKKQFHGTLCQFYLDEKAKPRADRVYPVQIQYLVTESQYHAQQAKQNRGRFIGKTGYTVATSAEPARLPHADPNELERILETHDYTLPIRDPSRKKNPIEASWSDYRDQLENHDYPPAVGSPAPIPISIEVTPGRASGGSLSNDELKRLAGFMNTTREAIPEDTSAKTLETQDVAVETSMPEELLPLGGNMETHPENRNNRSIDIITRGEKALAEGNAALAKSAWEEAITLAHDNPVQQLQIHGRAGRCYTAHYHHNDALSHLHQAVALSKKILITPELMDLLAQCHADIGLISAYRKDWMQALKAYTDSLALLPTSCQLKADVMFKYALCLDELGRYEEAIASYQSAVALAEKLPADDIAADSLYNLANLYFEQNRHAEAQATLETCLRYDRRRHKREEVLRTVMRLLEVHEAQHHLMDAERYGRVAYKLSKNEPELARIAIRLGRLAEKSLAHGRALGYYKKAQRHAVPQALQNGLHETIRRLEEGHFNGTSPAPPAF